MYNTTDQSGGSVAATTAGNIRVYKANQTETTWDNVRSSQAGIDLFEDFDTTALGAGVCAVHINTADDTDSGFYAAGNDYFIVLDEATVDGQTVSAAIAMFSIENRTVNADRINSDETAAANMALAATTATAGTVDNTGFTPMATQFEADDITEATADHYVDRYVYFLTGALAGQGGKKITAYSLATGRGHFTVEALTEAPGNDDTFVIL
jgi:hypothetical protein